MAQTAKTQSKRSSNGRTASQKTEKYRFAQNVDGEGTVAEREYQRYAAESDEQGGQDPDVLLDVPVVKVDSIHLEVEDLDAHVALQAKVLDLVNLKVGVDVHLGKVRLDVKGVEAQALVKVRLDHVAAIVDRVLTTIDRNPELVEGLSRAVEDVGSGAGHALGETGDAVEDVGEGAGEGVGELGEGAGEAVGELGEGAGQAVGEVAGDPGQAVGNLAEGAGQATDEAGNLVGDVTDAAGQATDAAGNLVGDAAGAAGGATDAAGDVADAGAGTLAKAAAKTMAKEIGSAASDEAKDLGLAATRKVKELGERRRQRRAEKHDATEAALAAAEDLDVDLDEVEGTGADGRITVNDVRQAAD
jgi:e3 binding domain